MADKPIQGSEIVQPAWSKQAVSDSDLFLEKINLMIAGIKELAKLTGKRLPLTDPKSLSEAEEIQRHLKKIAELENGITEARKLKIQVQEKEKKLNKQARDDIKGLTSAYAALQNSFNAAAQKAKDLAVAHGINSKAAKQAAIEANNLNKQLKAIDASVGNYQRNVGNYSSALSGLASQLGVTLSVGTVIAFGKSSIQAFNEAQKALRDLEFSLNNIAGEGTGSLDRLVALSEKLQGEGIFSDDDIQKASAMAIQFGLTGQEVEALIPKVADFAALTGQDLNSALEAVLKGIAGQGRGLKLYGIEVDATKSKQEQYISILGQLDKFQGANIKQLETAAGKAEQFKNRINDLQEGIGEFLIDRGASILNWVEKLAKGTLTVSDYFRGLANTILGFMTSGIVQIDSEAERRLKFKQQLVKKFSDASLLELKFYIEKSRQMAVDGVTEEEKIKGQISLEALSEVIAKRKSLKKRELDDDIDTANSPKFKEKVKKETEVVQQVAQREIEITQEKNTELEIMQQDFTQSINNINELARQQDLGNAKRARREQLQEAVKQLDQLSDMAFESLEDRNETELRMNSEKISELNSQIAFQQQLALQGEANTLAELQKQKAEALEEQAQLEAKAAKQKEAEQLAELFLEFMKVYAKDGFGAAGKATAATIAAKGLANLIAGNFAEGVENFKGKGNGTSDSNLIGFSNGESVVTAKGTSETPGLTTAVNEMGFEGAAAWAMKNIFPKIPVLQDKSMADQVNEKLTSLLIHEFKGLRKDLQNLPDIDFKKNALNEFIEIDKRMGITTETTYKKVAPSYSKH